MTPPIERLRYYDGEYLRAFDFADEQTYHLEMRRRLNMALHLSGIVEGLDFSQDPPPPATGVAVQWSINPGMAIDPYGREIVVFASFVLDEEFLAANKNVTSADEYALWLRYGKKAVTPPSAGYATCNSSNEYTRWEEGFSVVLLPKGGAPRPDPALTDPLSDDPAADQVGVQLGVVTVMGSFGALYVSNVVPANRSYIGLRAQRIELPNPADSAAYKISQQSDPSLPPPGLEVQSNLFVDQNLVVGTDFKIDSSIFAPTAPSPFPGAGNLKVASDIFVQGDLFFFSKATGTGQTDQWLQLASYVKGFQPDIQVGTQQMTLTLPTSPAATSGSTVISPGTPIALTPKFALVDQSRVKVSVSIVGVIHDSSYPSGQPVNYEVSPNPQGTWNSAGTFTFTPTWTTQVATNASSALVAPLSIIKINYVVVFYPL
ncbi:MAG TPA: hypothetical protein VHR66_25690 [Gemmataceae bacterium]|nr:hypothetical protein [Gemmataceae bacterium]